MTNRTHGKKRFLRNFPADAPEDEEGCIIHPLVAGQAQAFGLSPVLTQLGPVERGAQSSLETRLKCSRLDKIGTPTVRNVATEVRGVMKEGGAVKERPTHTNATQTVIAVESHLLPTMGMTRLPPPATSPMRQPAVVASPHLVTRTRLSAFIPIGDQETA